MQDQGFTEADLEPTVPCGVCGDEDGDDCSCYYDEDEDIDVAAYTDAAGW